MKRIGCPPGTIRMNDICVRPWFPILGTKRVQNIGNRVGCTRIEGTWDDDYGVCILKEYNRFTNEEQPTKPPETRGGWTAPVKGMIITWGVYDQNVEEPLEFDRRYPLHSFIEGYLAGEHRASNHGYSTISDYPIFEDYSLAEYSPTCYIEDSKEINEMLRHNALALAKEILDGNAGNHGLGYFTPEGHPVSATHKEAVAAEFSSEVRDAYSGIKSITMKPFKIRDYGEKDI